jgi:hypothetical protein
MIFTLVIGFVLFAAAELLLEARRAKTVKNRLLAGAAAYALTHGYYFLTGGGIGRVGAQFAMAAIAACLFAAASLNLTDGKDFETNAARMAARLAASVLFASVLLAGLYAVLWSVDTLLAELDYKWYSKIAQTCYSLFFPIMFLAGLPEKDDGIAYPKLLRALLRYVVTPVAIVFTAVLYSYYIKLIVTRSLPVGEVGGVSLAFLGVCIPALVLSAPFDDRLSVRLRRILPYALLPVIFVLFLASGRQIAAYGVTIVRYLVAAGGVTALICAALLTIRGGAARRMVCPVIAAACLLSAYGPQSAYNLSAYSQGKRLEGYLVKNDMLRGGVIVPNGEVSAEERMEIADIFRYFLNYDLDFPGYLPQGTNTENFRGVFGFAPYGDSHVEPDRQNYYLRVNGIVDIADYDYFLPPNPGGSVYADSAGTVEVRGINNSPSADHLTVTIDGGTVCDIPKREIAERILNQVRQTRGEVTNTETMTYDYENDAVKLRLIFSSILLNTRDAAYYSGNFYTLLKVK